jgi:hypothetical protein
MLWPKVREGPRQPSRPASGEFPFETGTSHDWESKMLQRCGSRINKREGVAVAGRASLFDDCF